MEQNRMEWNDNSSRDANTYVQNIQLVVKDKTSVVQVHALKGVIFFEDIETVTPLSRILLEGNWNYQRALMYLWLSQRQDLGGVSPEPKEVCSSVVFFGDISLACW